MTVTLELDNLDVHGKRTLVVVSAVILTILSHASYALRIWARKSVGHLQREDWFMGAALFFSYGTLICQFYGLSVGLGEHQSSVSPDNRKKLSISIWIIQRTQPFCLLCLKTSIILLYVRLFPTKPFRRVAWGIWIYTLLWTIAALGASTFECTPVSFFWNKDQEGHCIPNALRTVSFSNGVLSFVGDVFILCMPLPMVWKLQMNRRRKLALSGIFLVGLFVIITSIIRFVALLSINTADLTFTQVEAGVWTYMELGIGITCGNLPLLRPLFQRFFDSTSSNKGRSTNLTTKLSSRAARSQNSHLRSNSTFRDGFERMNSVNGADVESLGGGSEIELTDRRYMGEGIVVKTDVRVTEEETGGTRLARELSDPLRRPTGSSIEATRRL